MGSDCSPVREILMAADPELLLERLRDMVARLPEARLERMGQHAALRVRKKTFGWYMNDHHGDGVIGITCKVMPGEAEGLLRSDPGRFYLPAYTPKGWMGVRLDVPRVSWSEVRELVEGSYRLIAPVTLVRAMGMPRPPERT